MTPTDPTAHELDVLAEPLGYTVTFGAASAHNAGLFALQESDSDRALVVSSDPAVIRAELDDLERSDMWQITFADTVSDAGALTVAVEVNGQRQTITGDVVVGSSHRRGPVTVMVTANERPASLPVGTWRKVPNRAHPLIAP